MAEMSVTIFASNNKINLRELNCFIVYSIKIKNKIALEEFFRKFSF